MKRSGQTSRTVIALLAATLVLATTTAYFAWGSTQQRPSAADLSGEVAYKLQPYQVTSVGTGTTTGSALNSIAVSATGQATYTPNEALVQVTVVTQDSTAKAATQANAQSTSSVISALEGIGVSNSSIQTQGFSLNADYSSCYSSCVPSITGYTVSNSLQVNITSSSAKTLGLRAGQVIDTAVNAGANQVNLYFAATHSLLDQVTSVALKNAVGSADMQAQTIASSLGVSITGVISASEGGGYSPQPYYGYPVFAASVSSGTSATPIMPGTQSFSMTVQVVYSI
ncbi:MAG: SIMPL domain-containing protein [Nitrososphaerota archaeon]|nr:SIMPL domain-containing protein [Nitrososphaerota archaeon]MDG7023096.1 SIMPL domain-containing protein [Nitrososphaerota archaeon]